LALRSFHVCFLQSVFQARRAQSACFATVTLREVMTTGWAIELGGGHRGASARSTPIALMKSGVVRPISEAGERRNICPRQAASVAPPWQPPIMMYAWLTGAAVISRRNPNLVSVAYRGGPREWR